MLNLEKMQIVDDLETQMVLDAQNDFLDVWTCFLRRRRNLRRVPTTEEKPEVPIS